MLSNFLYSHLQKLKAALQLSFPLHGFTQQLREGDELIQFFPLFRFSADEFPLAVAMSQYLVADDVVISAAPISSHASEHDRRDWLMQLRRILFVELAEDLDSCQLGD